MATGGSFGSTTVISPTGRLLSLRSWKNCAKAKRPLSILIHFAGFKCALEHVREFAAREWFGQGAAKSVG